MNFKLHFVAQTDEKRSSLNCGCINFIDSFKFKNEKSDTLVKTLKDVDFILTRELNGDRWQFVKQNWPIFMKR